MNANNDPDLDQNSEKMLTRWGVNCKRSQIANYDAASFYSTCNKWLGIPTIVFSSIVGAGIFSDVGQSSTDQNVQILLGLISVSAAVFAALQTFLRFGENEAKCRTAAAEYGAVKREIDQLLVACHSKRIVLNENIIADIRMKMDTLSRDTPSIPNKIWKKSTNKVPLAQK